MINAVVHRVGKDAADFPMTEFPTNRYGVITLSPFPSIPPGSPFIRLPGVNLFLSAPSFRAGDSVNGFRVRFLAPDESIEIAQTVR